MKYLKKVDIIFFSFLAITTLILLFSWGQSPNHLDLLYTRVFVLIAVIGIIYINTIYKQPLLSLIRNTYPIIVSGYFYTETVFYNKLFFNNLDPYLIAADTNLFGSQPSLEFSSYFSNPLFSELMYFGYFSFYLMIFGFVLYIYFKNKSYFNEAVFMLSSSLYLFYFLFAILPSEGPQFYFTSPDNTLPTAFVFDKIMHFIQHNAEQPTGAFPSSHVGISVIILLLSRKSAPTFYKIIFPFVIALIMSTVYIKAHYLIDIIGALLVVPIIMYLSKIMYRTLLKKRITD